MGSAGAYDSQRVLDILGYLWPTDYTGSRFPTCPIGEHDVTSIDAEIKKIGDSKDSLLRRISQWWWAIRKASRPDGAFIWGSAAFEKLKELADEFRALLQEDIARAKGQAPLNSADGPIEPRGFRWKGHHYDGLTGNAFRLVKALWCAPNWSLPFAELASRVWGDQEVTVAERFGRPRTDANNFFEHHGISLEVGSTRGTEKDRIAFLIQK